MTDIPWDTMEFGKQYKYNGMIHFKCTNDTQWSTMPTPYDKIFYTLPDGEIKYELGNQIVTTSPELYWMDFGTDIIHVPSIFNGFPIEPNNIYTDDQTT